LPPQLAQQTTVHVLFSGFSSNVMEDQWASFVISALEEATPSSVWTLRFHRRAPAGNKESYTCALKAVRNLRLSPSDIIFLMEDDLIMKESALREMRDLLHIQNPCFVTPVDSAGSYILGGAGASESSADADADNIDPFRAPPSVLVPGTMRHWRTVGSITVSYAARLGTLDFYAHTLPCPTDDFHATSSLSGR
jgi:hypothetical protein